MTGFVEKKLAQIDKQKLPQHIGIIMDGNGRWALSKGRPRTFGHVRGAEALRMAVEGCRELGISALTVFAFSTENWQRPFEEVSFLMNLLLEYLDKEVDALDKQGIRFKVIGDTSKFSPLLQKKIVDSEAQTKNNTAMILNIALNYGARQEIVRAVKNLSARVAAGEINTEDIDEDIFSNELYTAGQPELDLLIRLSGELRISNFLLWQMAYAELYFSPMFWPDFDKNALAEAIIDFQSRQRRFGTIHNS